jgi:tritrans,polycis-undecaprenyl-diphosphate synthase [geranylgeranyl-diphosphate specific]
VFKRLLSAIGAYKVYEEWLWHQLKGGVKPEHIAIILDGNRRWASEQALNLFSGHEKGADKVEQLIDWCLQLGVKSITLYMFSTENFQRSKSEVEEIMRIAEERFQRILADERIHKNKVRVKVIGRVNRRLR